ncbi:MAG: AMP-binding protein [Bryobacterales bacterium]|nr:AMP-binding protein [Bryobacterales bacterium]
MHSTAAAGFSNRDGIETEQLQKLRSLLAALIPGNAFYTQKLRAAGIGPEIESLAGFCELAPFTQKKELIEDQRHNPPYGTDLTYPLERYSRFCQTSATTGKPMHWLDTRESWNWMLDSWDRVFEAAGVTARDRVFFAFSFGPFLGFWTAFEAAARLGCLCIPGGGMRSSARLHAILATGATVLCCTPTYAVRLAEVAAEEKMDLSASKVRCILVAGEPGGSIPATRAHIEKLWPGAKVADHHGMTETGPVSYGCARVPGVLHIIESAFIAEVIDPQTGRPITPGGTGELVLTNLGRTGSPLLRYRTGDIVQRAAEARCECGTYDLALPGGILGRTDDMLVVRGVNVYPSAVEDVLRAHEGIAEYRVEVHSTRALQELSLQIEPTAGYPDPGGLAQRLEAALHRAFALRIPVTPVPGGSLPRFEMKARRWVHR